MSDTVTARTHEPGDAETIAALRRLAIDEARPERGGDLLFGFDRPDADAIVEPASNPGEFWFVGEIEGIAVGYARMTIADRGVARIAMVEELFVHPDAREVGVAAGLLAACMQAGSEAGAAHIESEVLPGNREAKNFFERMGMKTRKMRVSTPLD